MRSFTTTSFSLRRAKCPFWSMAFLRSLLMVRRTSSLFAFTRSWALIARSRSTSRMRICRHQVNASCQKRFAPTASCQGTPTCTFFRLNFNISMKIALPPTPRKYEPGSPMFRFSSWSCTSRFCTSHQRQLMLEALAVCVQSPRRPTFASLIACAKSATRSSCCWMLYRTSKWSAPPPPSRSRPAAQPQPQHDVPLIQSQRLLLQLGHHVRRHGAHGHEHLCCCRSHRGVRFTPANVPRAAFASPL